MAIPANTAKILSINRTTHKQYQLIMLASEAQGILKGGDEDKILAGKSQIKQAAGTRQAIQEILTWQCKGSTLQPGRVATAR